jgi:carboxyl-terminal processing protease
MVGLALALVSMLAAGLWIGGHPATMPPQLREVFVDEAGGLTAEATELIEDNYYRAVSEQELVDSSLQGMARQLRRRYGDRFSEYLSPQVLDRFNEALEGRFSGIGLSVTAAKRGLRAERVFAGSPAEEAGIEVGDTIVSVEGKSIAGLSSTVASERIKGPEGSEVTVGLLERGSDEVRQLRLTRAEIEVPVASSRTVEVDGGKLGYVRLAAFSEGAHGFLRQAVEKVRGQGARGLVLDLRANGGGLLQEAVLAASIFLPEGTVVVTTKSRTQGDASYEARGGNLPAQPTVVLIDRGTASAAEILAAALADEAGAKVVGERSFGKGVFQQEVGLSNGGALKLTIGEYFTPDGANLGGSGIRPDLAARDRPATRRDEALARAYAALSARVER